MAQRDGKSAPKERNDRVIAVPVKDKRYADVRDLPKRTREELEQFFVTASEMTHKRVTIQAWKGPQATIKAIREAAKCCQRGGQQAA
jgi:inorganic pyrophosphatase